MKSTSQSHERVGIALLAAVALVVAPNGTASASPTSVGADSASATVLGGAPVAMSFPLQRTGELTYDTWVQYQPQDGTAVAGTDYEAASGSVLIPAGSTEAEIPAQALGASTYSPDKEFTLQLGAAGVGPEPEFAVFQGFLETGDSAGNGNVVSADMNGDGRADILVGNADGSSISVFVNTTAPGASTPSYAAPQSFAAIRPHLAPPTDVNGDGRPDLIVRNAEMGAREVSIQLNATTPGSSALSFAAPQVVSTGDAPFRVTTADFNGDGRPDIAYSNLGRDFVSVQLNTTTPGSSTATFTPPQQFAAGPGTSSVQAADLNGDGRPDLVVSSGEVEPRTVSVHLNTTAPGASTPSFAAQQTFPVAGAAPRSVVPADFNGDGRVDLIISSLGIPGASALLNTTPPGASTASFTQLEVLPAVGFSSEAATVTDLNRDGRPDLIAVGWEGNVRVRFNTTPTGAETLSFSVPQQSINVGNETPFGPTRSVAVTDVNGDGLPDLLFLNWDNSGEVSILLNTTSAPTATAPSLTSQQSFAVGEAPSAVATTDLNGDGRPDLLVANQGDDTVSALLNTTPPGELTPSFAAGQSFAVGEAPSAVAAADVSGDGVPDLLVANEGDDSVSVLLNTTVPGATTPSFAAEESFAAGSAPSAVASADVNGDGRPDLLVANQGGDSVSVLLNTTAPGAPIPSFAAEERFDTGEAPSAVAATDLNGDGNPDVFAANASADEVSVLLNTQYAASIDPASVTGTISYAIPQASLSPGPLSFGEQLIGTTASETVTLASTGGDELAVEGIAIVGPGAEQFSQANSCPSTLEVDSDCEVEVTYTPNTAGAAGATLIVTSDAPSSPDTVALTGVGYAPPLPPDPAPIPTPPLPPPIPPPPPAEEGGRSIEAQLRINRVRSRAARAKLMISLGGTIAKRARGAVRVRVVTRLRGRRVIATKRARIRNGRWQTRLALPWAKRRPKAKLHVSARFGGSPGVRSGNAKRRVGVR